jgi:hypothetical protein
VSGEAVAITGSNRSSVWYGLHDFLERRGECRWLCDGEVVPKKVKQRLSGHNIHEEGHSNVVPSVTLRIADLRVCRQNTVGADE